jgi:hypothetical protein
VLYHAGVINDDSHGSRRYLLETELVVALSRCLDSGKSAWGKAPCTFEFGYEGGWTDVVALAPNGEVLAFEAKLHRWRDALHQAYRSQCFANRAYVVVPERTAEIARQYEAEFRRRRVGLCSMSDDDSVAVLIDVDSDAPLQPWLAARAVDELDPGGRHEQCKATTSRKPRAKSATRAR